MFRLLKKIFGTAQSRKISKYKKIIHQVNEWDQKFLSLTDDALRSKTQEFRSRYQEGESLDQLLPEAFAVIKNVCRRLLGTQIHVSGYDQEWDMIPYDVQILGAIALHNGSVAEMQTGEGKTLTAVMPLYLNSLSQRSVHLVTVNDYLVSRDCQWVGTILRWLGLTTGALTNDTSSEERAEIYKCDVVYGSASEFGFDYLRDNSMAMHVEEKVQRDYFYAIVDEIDSILIDEARTPLIISGPVGNSKQLYHELKEGVYQIVKMQRDLCNRYATDARKLLDEIGLKERVEDEEPLKLNKEQEATLKLALEKLWIVSKGMPRNKILKRVVEDPDLRIRLDELDIFFYSEQNKSAKSKMLAELFIIIDEKANEYELTDKGINAWQKYAHEGSEDDFLMLDLGYLYAEIENDSSLSIEQKMEKKSDLLTEDAKRKERAHNLRQLLRAHLLMEKDVDYIVQDNAIVIIDENTGRPQPGRRFSDGLHQSIEAKEGVSIQKETQTYATVTLQNYFRMYDKLAGMTGTAMTEAGEFKEIYKMEVLEIPTNRPCVRKDAHDEIYMTEREKYTALLKDITEVHGKGRPILIGTESVEISEKLSKILKQNKLSHTILNAKHHEREAEIISEAGQRGAITIATNMAGRGTDIKLAKGVAELGGLYVIGTSRHHSRRIDRQLRGRCARLGDPGSSKFYVSFEDQLMRLFASPRLNALIKRFRPPKGEAISASILNRSIETAQKRIEQRNYTIRKYTLEYDDVINKQREQIYHFRNEVLASDDILEIIYHTLFTAFSAFVNPLLDEKNKLEQSQKNEELQHWLVTHFPVHFDSNSFDHEGTLTRKEYKTEILDKLSAALAAKFHQLELQTRELISPQSDEKPEDIINQIQRNLIVKLIDQHWQEHLLTIDYLRSEVSIRSVANKDPLMEFKQESFEAFSKMLDDLRLDIATNMFKITIASKERSEHPLEEMLEQLNFQTQQSFLPSFESDQEMTSEDRPPQDRQTPVVSTAPRIKRNALCPCGSGKKHKKCCG